MRPRRSRRCWWKLAAMRRCPQNAGAASPTATGSRLGGPSAPMCVWGGEGETAKENKRGSGTMAFPKKRMASLRCHRLIACTLRQSTLNLPAFAYHHQPKQLQKLGINTCALSRFVEVEPKYIATMTTWQRLPCMVQNLVLH